LVHTPAQPWYLVAPARRAGVLTKAAGAAAGRWVRWGVRGALGVGCKDIGVGRRLVQVGSVRGPRGEGVVRELLCVQSGWVPFGTLVPLGCISDMR
jgi:hypothetical protein